MKQAIFYIDDDVGCLNLFQERFGGEYDVRTAATLSEARRMLEERPADIVISDQSMPEIKGTDFLSEVARTHPPSYCVLMTGSIFFGEAILEIGDGTVHFFLPKPWTEEVMRHMFERAGVHIAQHRKAR